MPSCDVQILGLEPRTFELSARRSNLLSYTCAGVPGLEPRTTEPESAVLPITPYPKEQFERKRQDLNLRRCKDRTHFPGGRLKPDSATLPVEKNCVENTGFEPVTFCMPCRRATKLRQSPVLTHSRPSVSSSLLQSCTYAHSCRSTLLDCSLAPPERLELPTPRAET